MNRVFQTPLLALVIATTLGCAASTPETKVYSLSTSFPASPPSDQKVDMPIGVGPLLFPDKLKRPQIVTRQSNNRMTLSEQHHWAGNLEAEFLNTLVRNLTNNLGTARIFTFPWDNRRRPDLQVEITVYQFDGELGGECNLETNWSLISNDGKKILHQESSVLKQLTKTESYDSLVEAQSLLVGNLAETIAQRIRAIDSDRIKQ